MIDDTTTIRPGWRGVSGPATTTIISTKHATAPKPPRRRTIAIVAGAAAAAIAVGSISFGLLTPHTTTEAPLSLSPEAAVAARNMGNTVVNQGLAQDSGTTSTLEEASTSAAGALAADTQVKEQQDTAANAAVKAGQTALADAQAAWDVQMRKSGTLRIDYSGHDMSGTPVEVPDGAFIYPVSNFKITSPFGWRTDPVLGGGEFHAGVDLAVPCGTPIYASGDGVVSFSGWNGGFGNYIEINHGALSTGYGHQSRLVAKIGDHVTQGQLIGYVGSTGKSTGCHVHFAAINGNGQYFDPTTLVH